MGREEQRWIDISGLSLEQVHDEMAVHKMEGWELDTITLEESGQTVLRLVRRRGA